MFQNEPDAFRNSFHVAQLELTWGGFSPTSLLIAAGH